jgi:hypothetical protein
MSRRQLHCVSISSLFLFGFELTMEHCNYSDRYQWSARRPQCPAHCAYRCRAEARAEGGRGETAADETKARLSGRLICIPDGTAPHYGESGSLGDPGYPRCVLGVCELNAYLAVYTRCTTNNPLRTPPGVSKWPYTACILFRI